MNDSDFPTPITDRYFEDYRPGFVGEYGSITVSEDQILEFGRQFDPQQFHIDPVKAAHGPFSGLIASGWHTAAIMMRLYADHIVSKVASLGSPGVDELRWMRPVRPGDTLSIRATILEARRSTSKPDRGLVRIQVEVLNQDKTVVMSVKAMTLFLCRKSN
jgi:acyl dehydratase